QAPVQYSGCASHRNSAHGANVGGRSVLTPRSGAEIRSGQPADRGVVDRRPDGGVIDLAWIAQSLGARENRREVNLSINPFVVVFEANPHDLAVEVGLSHARAEGQI